MLEKSTGDNRNLVPQWIFRIRGGGVEENRLERCLKGVKGAGWGNQAIWGGGGYFFDEKDVSHT